MALLGTLAGLTASGLYAVVDELRVGHRIHSHQLSGTLIATMDYKVNDDLFDGIVRRFENDWKLDAGSLYPERLIGFFAENPRARQQWVRMQASILLHDSMQRRNCETDTAQFGDESNKYEREFGCAESVYISNHSEEARIAIEQIEQEQTRNIESLVKKESNYKRTSLASIVIGALLILSVLFMLVLHVYATSIAYIFLSVGLGLVVFGCCRMMYKANAIWLALLATALMLFYTFACHS